MLTNRRITIMLVAVAAVMLMGLLVTATVAAQAVRVVRDASTSAVHIGEVLDGDGIRWFGDEGDHVLSAEIIGSGIVMDGDFEIVEGPGVVIVAVAADSPAARAGVERGDIVLRVDGVEVDEIGGLIDALDDAAAGDGVELTVLHGDDEQTVTLTASDDDDVPLLGLLAHGAMPAVDVMVRGHGLPFLPPMIDLPVLPSIEAFELPDGLTRAVIVGSVSDDSPAAAAGLTPGDLITVVDGETVADVDTLVDAVKARAPGDTVAITAYHPGDEEERVVTVTLGDHPDEPGEAFLGVGNLGMIEISGDDGERDVEMWRHVEPFRRLDGKHGFSLPGLDLPDEIDKMLDDLREERDRKDAPAENEHEA